MAMTADASSESFSTQWCKRPLPLNQNWLTSWNPFVVSVETEGLAGWSLLLLSLRRQSHGLQCREQGAVTIT